MVHHNRRGPLLALVILACLGLAAPATGVEMQPAPDLGRFGALRVSESTDTGVSIKCRGFGSIVKPYDPTLRSAPAGGGMPLDPSGSVAAVELVGSHNGTSTHLVGYGMIIDPDG